MKKLAIFICTAVMMSATVPAFAADQTKTKSTKDECLLASKECATQVDSIQQKMKRLQTEINKGTKVYTPEELKKLGEKLDETDKMLDHMLKP